MKKNVLLIIVLLAMVGCSKDTQPLLIIKPNTCDSAAFSYSLDIRPIIGMKCSGSICHSGGNSNYDYSTYEVFADRIRTGRLEERLLLPKNDPLHMPDGRTLDSCDLFKLRTWIHQGFNNN